MTMLFLAQRLATGFGVALVATELARALRARGVDVRVGCMRMDVDVVGLDVPFLRVGPTPRAVAEAALAEGATHIVAHTSPYFDLLPEVRRLLPPRVQLWCWEHGDPTPTLFPAASAADRAARAQHKRAQVYPACDGVVAISEFVRQDIRWPDAVVVPNGCDHVADQGTKPFSSFASPPGAPLRIGTLARLGRDETHYKGRALFLDLVARLRARGIAVDAAVAGRGTAREARALERAGIDVRRNLPEEEKLRFLRGLDVFVAPSLWEGFDLPLVEAQALGTLGVAFDTGAHPEVTPFVFRNLDELERWLTRLATQRVAGETGLLREGSQLCHRFVRNRFTWARAAAQAAAVLLEDARPSSSLPPVTIPAWRRVVGDVLRESGARRLIRLIQPGGSAR